MEFIRVIGLSAVWPLVAHAQQTPHKTAKIGMLWHAGNADEEKEYLDALTGALRDLGYIECKNVEFLHRFPAEQPERFRELARDLIDNKADVIVVQTQPGAMALKQATTTIPIVFVSIPDPIGAGLVESLARPGGNLTGLSIIAKDIVGKRWGLFKEAVPTLSRVALLIDPSDSNSTAPIPAHLSAAPMPSLVPWRCSNPNHSPFLSRIRNVIHQGNWCPACDTERRQLHPPRPKIARAVAERVIGERGGEIVNIVGGGAVER